MKQHNSVIPHLLDGEQLFAPDFILGGAMENIAGATDDIFGGKRRGLCMRSGRRNGIPVAT